MAQQIKKKYIQDGAIDGQKLKLLEGQSIVQESSEGDVELIKLDNTGKVIVSGKETAFKEDVESEASARQAALAVLQAVVDQEISDRQSADNTLQSNIDSEASSRSTADSNLQTQITNIQDAGDVLFEDDASVYADATAPIEDPKGRDGWYYKSSGSDKVNWYFFDGIANTVTVGDFENFYAVALVDTQGNDTFHLAYYTQMQGDGQDAGSWYRSRQVFVPVGSFDRGVKCLFWAGQEPDASLYPEMPRVQMQLSTVEGSTVGPNDSSETFLTAVFGTNSAANAGAIELVLNKLGFNSSSYDKENTCEIRGDFTLRGIKESVLEESILREQGDVSLQNNIDAEASARQAADSSLQSQINDIISNVDPSALDSLSEIVSAFQSADSDLQDSITSVLGTHTSELNSEISARQSADSTLQSNIDSEESSRIAADNTLQSNIDSEESARIAADSSLQSSLNTEISNRQSADTTLQGNIDSEESARISADNVLQSNIDSEESARIAADSSLQSNIDAEESARISGDASLQSQINDILSNTDPAALDSLSEIVSAFQSADSDLNDAITNVLGTHTSELASETSARQSADSALSGRLDVLEAYEFKKEKMVLSATDISNGYVDLGFLARSNSIRAFVGRLAMHEGASDDYTVSNVGGVSRITFVGNMVNPSEEQLVEGDVLHFSYEA